MEEELKFEFDGVTMECLNPEAFPVFKKNLAKLIVKLMEKQREEERQLICAEKENKPEEI